MQSQTRRQDKETATVSYLVVLVDCPAPSTGKVSSRDTTSARRPGERNARRPFPVFLLSLGILNR